MKLLSVSVENFKSLKSVNIDGLGGLNTFVGPNGAGKTNLADSLGFLGTVFKEGLQKAMISYGGFENICYRRIKRSSYVGFKVKVELDVINEYILEYEFKLKSASAQVLTDFYVEKDTLKIYSLYDENTGISISRNGDKIKTEYSSNINNNKLLELISRVEAIKEEKSLKKDELLFVFLNVISDFFANLLNHTLGNITMFQINPLICKKGGVPSITKLGRYGENTATALKIIKEKRENVFISIQDFMKKVMPDLEMIDITLNTDRTFGIEIKEKGVKRAWNVEELSDGTLRMLSMLIAVADPDNKVIVIEEPENNIHPLLLREFYSFCEEVAKYKQLFITTHSIVFLNKLNEGDNVYIVYRDDLETNVKPLLSFEGIEQDLDYEYVGDLIFSGKIKEYLPSYRGVKNNE